VDHIIGLEFGIGEEFIVELKSVMDACIARAMEEDPSVSKKSIAMNLGYTQADLSHWLSPKCPKTTMPSHLMPLFCILVRDNTPLWMIQEAYEKGRVTAA
jgi:hypothetical protein